MTSYKSTIQGRGPGFTDALDDPIIPTPRATVAMSGDPTSPTPTGARRAPSIGVWTGGTALRTVADGECTGATIV